jgi:hypothetical protein
MRCDVGHVIPIDMLSDDVLLPIFEFYYVGEDLDTSTERKEDRGMANAGARMSAVAEHRLCIPPSTESAPFVCARNTTGNSAGSLASFASRPLWSCHHALRHSAPCRGQHH